MNSFVFHSINAGLYFYDGHTGIFIDGIHTGAEVGFSDTPKEVIHEIFQSKPENKYYNHFVFTHAHPDHFDPATVASLCKTNLCAKIYVPKAQSPENTLYIPYGEEPLQIDGYTIVPFSTTHDGKEYQEYPHNSLLILTNGKGFFVAGDAILEPSLVPKIQAHFSQRVNCVFLNIYQLLSPSGQEFLKLLQPKRIFLYHLPFPKDDLHHFHPMANNELKKVYTEFVPPESLKPMTQFDLTNF